MLEEYEKSTLQNQRNTKLIQDKICGHSAETVQWRKVKFNSWLLAKKMQNKIHGLAQKCDVRLEDIGSDLCAKKANNE